MLRNGFQKVKDFATFPLRAITLFYEDRWGLSSLATERFDYVRREVRGYCLDVGCGPNNRFINSYMDGNGKGIDVFPYDGLTEENIVTDMLHLPFEDSSFDSVTFIANLNHVPRSLRDGELAEAYRCLRPGGNIVVTMGSPIAEILVHKVVGAYDRLFGTRYDVDTERGMSEEEEYFLTSAEIVERLARAGFKKITHKKFLSQWGLNGMFIGWKP